MRQARARLTAAALITTSIALGLLIGISSATTVSTPFRAYAAPYVGAPDLFECGNIQSSVFTNPPVAVRATSFVNGTYGVYCGAGYHQQIQAAQVQLNLSGGLCYGPIYQGYVYGYSNAADTGSQSCGHAKNYYAVSSAWLLVPGVGTYFSNDSNGGYPDIAGPMFYP
jgi:hypothetical protein